MLRVMTISYPCDRSLPAQPISTQQAQSRKNKTHTFALKNVPAVCDHHESLLFWLCNKETRFACFPCFICVPCSVHLISTYYVRKGSCSSFYLNYPQINKIGKSDHMSCDVICPHTFLYTAVSIEIRNAERISFQGLTVKKQAGKSTCPALITWWTKFNTIYPLPKLVFGAMAAVT